MLVHHWSHPTTPAGTGWDTVISGAVQLVTEKGFIARAALGEAEVIEVIVDDPTGTLDFKRLHRWYMVEDETAGDQLVWNGYIVDQYIMRGDEGETEFLTGTGRRWHLDIQQENALLGFRAITGEDGDRPAETPGEQLTWLLASDYLSTVLDHGLIDWTALNALPDMDAVDYRPQTAADVLRSISLVTGFNHYIRYRDASSDIELAFYDANTSDLDPSSLKISNDPADLDAGGDFASTSIYAPSTNATLHRKSDRVAAGIVVQWPGGFEYGYDLDTSYEFGFIDQVVQAPNIKTQAKAQALLQRLLRQHRTQDERIENLRIRVPAANVNDVKHGQWIEAKFVHLPGWEDLRGARVIYKTFGRPDGETQKMYDIDLELSPKVIACPSPTPLTTFDPLNPSGTPIFGNAPNIGAGELSYGKPGIVYPEAPDPTHIGAWHFPTWGSGGTADIAGDCSENSMRICVVGNGTLVWPVGVGTGTTHVVASLQYRPVGGDIVTVEEQFGLSGETFTFDIDTEDQTHCTNWVHVCEDINNFSDPCGGKAFKYGGSDVATWTPL